MNHQAAAGRFNSSFQLGKKSFYMCSALHYETTESFSTAETFYIYFLLLFFSWSV